MSRLLLTSDLHLGHKNVLRFRSQFETQEQHDETLFENLASSINKRDSVFFMGDVAFNTAWLERIAAIKCAKKTLILGNHDLENGVKMIDLIATYDRIESLYSKRNVYFSHCPIHPSQFRSKTHNIHGHLHESVILDDRYINVCVEHTDWKPVAFSDCIL
jgi:calcineurin-like phosphoesterase family protein